MTNLIRVHNLTTKKTRLYLIADADCRIAKGTLVRVQFGNGNTALGIAAKDSFCIADDQIADLREMLGLDPDGSFKRVVSVYDERAIEDPADEDEDDQDAEDEDDQDAEDEAWEGSIEG